MLVLVHDHTVDPQGSTGHTLEARVAAMFEWLKEITGPKAKPKAGPDKAAKSANNIQIDSRSYPLLDLTLKGVVVGDFDGTLVENQVAKVTVTANDRFGKFSFPATVTVSKIADRQMVAVFNVLEPQISDALNKYAQMKKAAGGARRAG